MRVKLRIETFKRENLKKMSSLKRVISATKSPSLKPVTIDFKDYD